VWNNEDNVEDVDAESDERMQRSSNLHDSSDNGKQSDEANRGVSGGGNMKN